MVNDQIGFNNTYSSQQIKEVNLRRKRFTGELIIKDYSELEVLNLREIRKIDKLVLKNLTQLQEVIIWDCGIKELIIENCPQVRKLNLRKNSLINLEFV